MSKFNDFWSQDKFDPKGRGFIPVNVFPELLYRILDEEIKQMILY